MNFYTHSDYKGLISESMLLQGWQLEYKVKTTDKHLKYPSLTQCPTKTILANPTHLGKVEL